MFPFSNDLSDVGRKNCHIGVRRCHAHVSRFGGSRGGGKRGGKGSLPRYLLDHGVTPKMMVKMMSKLLLFNYICEREVYRHAMLLFLDEYKDHVNSHVRSNYLDPDDPRKLGGRSAGVQGQVGSTNGLERRGGIWQEQWRALRAKNSVDDQNNFLMMIEGKMKHHLAHMNICGISPCGYAYLRHIRI